MTSNSNTINNTSTISRQDQQQDNQKEQYNENNYYYNNYNNITRSRACSSETTDELPGNEIMEKIAEAYRANINQVISMAAAGVIEEALRHGMEPATVILAIEETGLASRPSPYYLRAVLRNWAEWGVITCRAREKSGTTDARPWWR